MIWDILVRTLRIGHILSLRVLFIIYYFKKECLLFFKLHELVTFNPYFNDLFQWIIANVKNQKKTSDIVQVASFFKVQSCNFLTLVVLLSRGQAYSCSCMYSGNSSNFTKMLIGKTPKKLSLVHNILSAGLFIHSKTDQTWVS